MMVDIGLKFLSAPFPTPGVTEVKVTNLEFSYKSKTFLRLSL